MVVLFLLSVVAVAVVQHFRTADPPYADEMRTASETMQRALGVIAAGRASAGPPLDSVHDVNMTGLIGGLFTPLTSTTGNLAAKRTTTNPNAAALLVHLFHEAGVRRGDSIAVGGSGSFPALVVATLCAAQAMDLDVSLIVSLAASQWGANLPGLTWLDMEAMLSDSHLFPPGYATVAASVGGSDDRGSDLLPTGRDALRDRILDGGVALISEADLAASVAARMDIYLAAAPAGRVAAFVNIGGSWANLGTSAEVLALRPGVNKASRLPGAESWGVLHAMAAREVPVIHLLNIASLADEYGMPWDPTPLPAPGTWRPESTALRLPVLLISIAYGVSVAAWLIVLRRRTRRSTSRSGQTKEHRSSSFRETS